MSMTELADPTAKAPAVDFMSLLGRCLGNFKMVERVLTAFRESGLADLNQLHNAIEAADLKSAAEISHRFKGSAGNVSAVELHKSNGLILSSLHAFSYLPIQLIRTLPASNSNLLERSNESSGC